MAINLKFDLMGNPEPPSIVLANRNGNKLGQLDVDAKSIDVKDLLKTSEFSFTLNKYVDGELTPHWDKVVDFKLVYCLEWDLWYSINVELDEATETVKTVFCTQLGQEELSQIKLYNIQINTEEDIARDDYKISILYDEDNKDASIFHRVMSKAPHYSIAYIDESLKRIQKSFSFDDASICDALDEIEEEVGCLVVYNSNSDKNGMPKRDISIYDLLQNCKNPSCKHRGEFTDKCPKCGSTDIDYGYGEDTTIFVTSDELATEGIQFVTDTDSVKNCFKLEAGDDLMTATIRNCNPNGSDYIWYFSNAVKEDMSKELVEAIEGYDAKYKEYYDEHISNLDTNSVNRYNALVEKYDDYYNTKSTCINCKHEGYFENECPSCHSKNILTGKRLKTINAAITGYPDLMTAYYNTIDLSLYLKSGLMPSVEMSDTNAEAQLRLLTTSALSPVAVNVEKISSVSLATANSAVLSMAKVLVRPTYKVEIKEDSSSLSAVLTDGNGEYRTWKGKFVVTNYSDKEDSASHSDDEMAISVRINNNTEEFIKQKIEKALNKENTDDLSISGLFNEEKYSYTEFCNELKKYALNPLKSFYESCDACLSILAEQGAGDEDGKPDLYENLYEPYYNKSLAIAEEIALRENEIAIIEGIWDKSYENIPKCTAKGLQQYIEDCQQEIQDELDFESYLGEDLWLDLCAYRREDKYSNSNYVSDGLNNAELFEKANEFIEVAEEEIFKSAELQHSISATLNNLLSLPKFKPLIKHFKTGNWIRVQIDDKVYKLRLIEYNFNYGDVESIPVEFSDLTKIKNGTTDVQEIFSQAASMASSYDSIQRQAKKGDVARNTIDQWISDGLDSADVQIKSNNSEEILLTKNGLLARSYNDITGTYLPEQFKLTHNIMAYTSDNWETVSSALGKHKYTKWDGSSFINDEDYGLSAKFAQAAYIIGSQIIGGEIVSSNYQPKQKGTHIDLLNGDFDFAGGKIVYNAENNNVTLKGVTIQWDGEDAVNPPAIQDVTGLTDEIEKINAIDSALSPTTINGKSVVSPLIVGGYLNIKNDVNKTGVVIDPNSLVNSEYVFRVYNNNGTAIGLDVNGNAEFSGTIQSSKIISPDIEGGTIKGVDITAGSTLKVGEQKDEDGNVIGYNTWITNDGTLNADYANISGEVRAASGSIGGFAIKPNDIENDKVYGWLYSGESIGSDKSIFLSATDMQGNADFFDETINNWRLTIGNKFGVTSDGTAYMSDCEITGGSLRMGNVNDGYSAWISVDEGVLNANGVNISGAINAVNGSIGGWQITTDALYKNVYGISSGMCSVQKTPSERLEYTLNNNGTYTVSGIGTCTDIHLVIPQEYLGIPVTTIGMEAFYGCTNLVSVTIPDSVTSIGYRSFFSCTNLTNITIPDSVTGIGQFAFNGCRKLTSVIIPDSVRQILGSAFSGCNGLTSITIGSGVTTIGDYAFNGCDSLAIVYYTGSESDWNTNVSIGSNNSCLTEATFYYRDENNNSYSSLVNNGTTSLPRFFAGSVSNIPTSINDANFLVLEDGSLYASAAKIKGHIEATSGSFDGDVYAKNGKIGGLFIQEKGISSGDGGLTFDSSGLIIAQQLEINDYFKANTLKIGQISGRADGSAQLNFESSDATSRTINADVTMNVIDAGSDGFIGIGWKEGQANIIVTTYDNDEKETNLITSKVFTVNLRYSDGYSHVVDRTLYITVKSGEKSGSSTVANKIWDGVALLTLRLATITPVTYVEKTNAVVHAIKSSGSLLPSVNNLNLGSLEDAWDNVYINTSYYLGGEAIDISDKNKKNTIAPINEKYSTLFDILNPVTFKLNNGTSNRTHMGLIAQEVKEAMDNCGIDSQDLAAYCSWQGDDGNESCGIRYGEFVSLCIYEIQKLKRRVVELENKFKKD